MRLPKHSKEETDEILAGASDYASGEFASTNLSDKHKDTFLEARTARRIRITGDNAANEYYRETGKHFDNDDSTEVYIRIFAMVFAYLILALFVNLFLYLPVKYLAESWAGVNSHDATYIAVIINTAIGTILFGMRSEVSMKRKAFIAGMQAEANDQILGKYHEANAKRVSRSQITNDDSDSA